LRLVADERTRRFLAEQGNKVYVWPSRHRCCGGTLTLVRCATEQPDGRAFERAEIDGVGLYLDRDFDTQPDEIHVNLKGRRRPRLEAYWNGCAFVV
jgi:hypothetical protein